MSSIDLRVRYLLGPEGVQYKDFECSLHTLHTMNLPRSLAQNINKNKYLDW